MRGQDLINSSIETLLADVIRSYEGRNPKSKVQHEYARQNLPGGNTRSVIYCDPFPITLASGQGAYVTSLDGDEYVDFLGEYTAGLFGHSDPSIRSAINQALDGGISLGGHNLLEARLAEIVCRRIPSIESVRFANSGTEANLMAVSTARAITGRSKVMVFEGAYHGSVFMFGGAGSPLNAPFQFILAPYNDLEMASSLVHEHGDELAAIIVEPMLGAGGCIPAEVAFLSTLRELATKSGSILIFDEVMTSRLAPGGLQEVHGILPDLTTLGKYIAGGMSFGAFGGRQDIMARFDPGQPQAFPHAGTFNNNVLSMAAGIAAMANVYTPEKAVALNDRGNALRARLNGLAQEADVSMNFTGFGSMMTVHMQRNPLRGPIPASQKEAQLRDLFFFDLLKDNIWIAKRGMINLSLPMGEAQLSKLEGAVAEFIDTREELLG